VDLDPKERLKYLYSDALMVRLKAYVGRRYFDFGDWEGWFEEAHQNTALKIEKLPENRKVSDALIFAVFKNELVSVKRNRLGYPRPRQWLREFSQLGQDLFEWICLKKMPRRQVIERAKEQRHAASYADVVTASAEANNLTDLLEHLINQMNAVRECDGVRPETDDINAEHAPQYKDDSQNTEHHTDAEQIQRLLSVLLGTVDNAPVVKEKAAKRLEQLRSALTSQSELSDEDVLVLRCYYYQGMSQSEVAKLVGKPLQQVVRQREAAITRIRATLEKYGLTRDALLAD